MKAITEEMIKIFHINELGFDMMGYKFKRQGDLSFHHLLIPRRLGGPETIDNGAILRQKTSHDYLHVIEKYDPEIFYAITSELIDENILRRIEYNNLKQIHDLLLYFEREHDRDTYKNGNYIIRPEYITTRIPILEEDKRRR